MIDTMHTLLKVSSLDLISQLDQFKVSCHLQEPETKNSEQNYPLA